MRFICLIKMVALLQKEDFKSPEAFESHINETNHNNTKLRLKAGGWHHDLCV